MITRCSGHHVHLGNLRVTSLILPTQSGIHSIIALYLINIPQSNCLHEWKSGINEIVSNNLHKSVLPWWGDSFLAEIDPNSFTYMTIYFHQGIDCTITHLKEYNITSLSQDLNILAIFNGANNYYKLSKKFITNWLSSLVYVLTKTRKLLNPELSHKT